MEPRRYKGAGITKGERVARREGLPAPILARRTVGVRSARTREAYERRGWNPDATLTVRCHRSGNATGSWSP